MFTFKNDPRPTGLYAVGYSEIGCAIKVKKKEVGRVIPPCWSSPDNLYRVQLMIVDSSPGDWKNITLAFRGETLEETKAWLKSRYDSIVAKYDLHREEND